MIDSRSIEAFRGEDFLPVALLLAVAATLTWDLARWLKEPCGRSGNRYGTSLG